MNTKNEFGLKNLALYFKELNEIHSDRFIDKEYQEIKKRSLLKENEIKLPKNVQDYLENIAMAIMLSEKEG